MVGVHHLFTCTHACSPDIRHFLEFLSHVTVFRSVLRVFGQHTRVILRVCLGLAGIETIMGWLSLML